MARFRLIYRSASGTFSSVRFVEAANHEEAYRQGLKKESEVGIAFDSAHFEARNG